MLEKCYKIENNIRQFDFTTCLKYLNHLGKSHYGTNFQIEISDKETLFKLISFAVGAEEDCKTLRIDLKKGILLLGPVGCGKTTLINLLNHFVYPHQKYQVKSTREIASEFHKDGYEIIHRYGRREKAICLDDLGIEQNIKHFGNECNTIGEILLHRYDMHINYGILTHATTNLNAEELEKLYGNRVRSRLRSMFNLISFPMETKDKRK
ncbi:MAG: ATPase [Crocinitomicaceae bacterium]|nr:ATPase [Crocinitomicaceae bacterium]